MTLGATVDDGTTHFRVWAPHAGRVAVRLRPGTGDEKQIVGIAKAVGDAYPERPNSVPHVVDLVPVKKLKRPVTLKEIKADKRFEKFQLTYMPRLSVMPVEAEWWEAIIEMSEKPLS